MQIRLEADEIRELRTAVDERIVALGKIRKKLTDSGLSPTELDYHLELLQGDGAAGGLRDRLSEQLSLLEAADPTFGAQEAEPQLDLEDPPAEDEKPEGWQEGDGEEWKEE